jgi:hypothetical protein
VTTSKLPATAAAMRAATGTAAIDGAEPSTGTINFWNMA